MFMCVCVIFSCFLQKSETFGLLAVPRHYSIATISLIMVLAVTFYCMTVESEDRRMRIKVEIKPMSPRTVSTDNVSDIRSLVKGLHISATPTVWHLLLSCCCGFLRLLKSNNTNDNNNNKKSHRNLGRAALPPLTAEWLCHKVPIGYNGMPYIYPKTAPSPSTISTLCNTAIPWPMTWMATGRECQTTAPETVKTLGTWKDSKDWTCGT